MPYTQYPRLRRALALGAMAVVALTPVLAQAQFKVNDLYGKTFPQVSKMLGKPVETQGDPLTYSRFKTPGALDTIVWYFYNTGQVGKAQIQILAKPGETADQILKRYGLAIGSNPHVFPGVKPPAKSMVSNGAVAGMPWTKVFISYMYAMPFKQELVNYCRQNHLDPAKTYFWTIQVSNKKGGGDRMMGTGDTPPPTKSPKPTKKKGKG